MLSVKDSLRIVAHLERNGATSEHFAQFLTSSHTEREMIQPASGIMSSAVLTCKNRQSLLSSASFKKKVTEKSSKAARKILLLLEKGGWRRGKCTAECFTQANAFELDWPF